jgi:hypothetical protein
MDSNSQFTFGTSAHDLSRSTAPLPKTCISSAFFQGTDKAVWLLGSSLSARLRVCLTRRRAERSRALRNRAVLSHHASHMPG